MEVANNPIALNYHAIEEIMELPVVQAIGSVAGQEEKDVYLVGGFVRDLLMGKNSKDIDVVVVGDGIPFAEKVAEKLGPDSRLAVFKNFMTANIKTKHYEVEFVGARQESYRRDSRKPIVEAGSLGDDLRRRDLTINALAIGVHQHSYGELVDYFNGVNDLENRIIRTPLEPHRTFDDDPLRMIRAIRFACQLSFRIDPDTFEAIKANKERIAIVSQERVTEELEKIILAEKPSVGFELLHDSGLLAIIFPELEQMHGVETVQDKSHKDNFFHTLKVLDNVAEMTDDEWLRWAALLHDIGKPKSKKFEPGHGWTFHGHEIAGARMVPKIFKRLRLPLNEKMKYVQKLVRLHLRPIALTEEVTDSAIRRLNYDAGNDIDDLLTLCKADITSKNQQKVTRFLKRFDEVWEKIQAVEEKDRIRNWQPPIGGEEIMETFGIKPSKEVGMIKDAIKEAVLNNEIDNNYEEAYHYMLEKGKALGLTPKK